LGIGEGGKRGIVRSGGRGKLEGWLG